MGRLDIRSGTAMSKNLFITGTGTDVGKTFITGLILKKLHQSGASAAYYKAAMSGNERSMDGRLIMGDAVHVKKISNITQPLEEMCPYIYENAVSPHLASRMEGNPIRLEKVIKNFNLLSNKYDYVTMEGSGGILCPVCFDEEKIFIADIIKKLNMGCIIVADAGLGTINNVGLTVFYMKSRQIPIKGIIFNNYEPENMMHRDNADMCEHLTGIKVIARVKKDETDIDVSADFLKSLYE